MFPLHRIKQKGKRNSVNTGTQHHIRGTHSTASATHLDQTIKGGQVCRNNSTPLCISLIRCGAGGLGFTVLFGRGLANCSKLHLQMGTVVQDVPEFLCNVLGALEGRIQKKRNTTHSGPVSMT